jgi:hypothetical protein
MKSIPKESRMRTSVIQGHFPTGFARIAEVRQRLARTNPQQAKQPAPHSVAQPHGAANAMQLPDTLASFATLGGEPLPPVIRQKMESFYGTSFADVRVHVGPHASAIGALAFTQGSHIHFAPGQYNPSSPTGQQILGHELAHVVQQRSGRVRNPFGSGVAVVQDHALESEADRLGARAAAHSLPVQGKFARAGAAASCAPGHHAPACRNGRCGR